MLRKTIDQFKDDFDFIFPGYNVRPLEMSGAIGLVQLKKVDEMIRLRRKNAEVFKELFGDETDVPPGPFEIIGIKYKPSFLTSFKKLFNFLD